MRIAPNTIAIAVLANERCLLCSMWTTSQPNEKRPRKKNKMEIESMNESGSCIITETSHFGRSPPPMVPPI